MDEECSTIEEQSAIKNSTSAVPDNLRILFAVHALLTLAAGVVLIVAPELIPGAVGIKLEPNAYLLCYLLAAAELSIAYLSWSGKKISDVRALRFIITAFIVFHAASGILEIYASAASANAIIRGNVVVRVFIVFLFAYYGFYKMPKIGA